VRARALTACLAVVLAAALAACGAERSAPPAATVGKDTPTKRHRFAPAGVEITLPETSTVIRHKAPAVFRAGLGQAYLAVFAYRRAEQLPRGARELRAARRRLVREIRRRDRRFKVASSRSIRVAGARAVEVVGEQRIAHGTFRTRSLHVYKGRGEYVIDMLAPTAEYARVSRTFFEPALRTVRLSGKIERRR
jgi:hypothetical protein